MLLFLLKKEEQMKQWLEIKESAEKLKEKYHLSNDDAMLIVNPESQEMYLIKNLQIQKMYKISTGKTGIGNEPDSGKTPYGTHRISEKFGQNAEWGTIFKARKPSDIIAKVFTEKISAPEDGILTRIMWLDGMEIGINKGGNVDTHNRYIYIHGTPEEGFIGEPVSHGCIRMKNADIMELFDEVSTGTLVEILNKEYKK
jgi:lipoprotein-anchoring transpeptidase ErfK/SrfK